MCGIFAVVNDKSNNASLTVLEGLKKLEYRGYDSWGIAIKTAESDKLRVQKQIGKIGDAKTNLPKGSIAIGHTRWATHGGVTDENAHPHLDCSGKIGVIHNGIVENYFSFKERLIKNGHKFASETDTEVIAHLIEEKSEKMKFHESVFKTFNSLVGSNAIVVIDYKSETIVACRNGSPLVIGIDEKNHQFFLGSDVPAFLKFTNHVHFLEDGEAVVINKHNVKIYDYESGKEKKLIIQKLDWKFEDAEKSGYPHFILKEIMEQPSSIGKTALINQDEIKKIAELVNQGYKPVLIGCGTAFYCALAGKYLLSMAGIESQAYRGYEFLPFAKFINNRSLVITISQSGETADTLIAVRNAKKSNGKIVSLVNSRGSTLERLSDILIPVGSGPEIAVVSTKAFTAQLATLYLITKAITGHYDEGKEKIKNLSSVLEKWLKDELFDQLMKLAKILIDQEHLYLIGKHLNFPATLEFALKLKESAYIHAEPFAAGELKHGVITLIQKNTPCIVLASNDDVKDEILSSAAELKARGGKIIGIAPFVSNEFDENILTPDLAELTIFANIITGQLLGYYLSIGRGADPDKPRNLAKSVTVK